MSKKELSITRRDTSAGHGKNTPSKHAVHRDSTDGSPTTEANGTRRNTRAAREGESAPSTQAVTPEALLAYLEWQGDSLARFGFYVHGVQGVKSDDSFGVNYHTHGLAERFPGQLDLQITLPIRLEAAMAIFHAFVDQMKEGRRFRPGYLKPGVLLAPVVCITAIESGRTVLRLVMPDPEGRWPVDAAVTQGYAAQLEEVVLH